MTNRYSDKVLAQGESYEDSPEGLMAERRRKHDVIFDVAERAQASLAEALEVLKTTADSLVKLADHVLDFPEAAAGMGTTPHRLWTDRRGLAKDALEKAAKADALLARGGK